ncbi:DUF3108 domain-containing protein [Reinekea sp.]|jgi:hypothetical protein|uniref:DUF3108 domain-containing protein n=1 Tax=Reinekea sp. TaxID=1970455 RepID=UPI002A82F24B|nr:DUF3108 domain-containing protein [Reinekea sp.]
MPLLSSCKTLVVFLVTCLMAVHGLALSNYRADITATRHGTFDIKLDGVMTFLSDAQGDWSLEVRMKGGPISSFERSVGETLAGEFRPLRYQRDTKVLFFKEHVDWQFDWGRARLSGQVKKKALQYDLDDTIHDPMSFQLPLRAALLQGETRFEFQFMRYTRPELLKFEVIGEELLILDKGRVHTLILKQIRPIQSGQKKLIWVAPKLDFVPLRFTTFEDDEVKDDILVKRLWLDDQEINF